MQMRQRGYVDIRLISSSQSGVFPLFLIQPMIWIGVIAIAFAGAMWMKSDYDEEKRDEGRSEIQAKWDKDVQRRIKQTTGIITTLYANIAETDRAQAKRELEVNARFSTLESRVAELTPGRRVPFSRASADIMSDAERAANAKRPNPAAADGGAKPNANTVSQTTDTVAFDEREMTGFVVAASKAYTDAFTLWELCREREDKLRTAVNALTKGSP